uniref:NADH-ubiquinone oxidoreductase chain 3 n=1 Tax=Spathius agrili TaxID=314331 RepID=D8KZU1_SPAAG|nr:NADH dehydrogenase subunit 3 [Spathius agrili]ACJ06260.1 NADH dehydrogenase subunit 3 [Spathius agrili]
MILLWMMLILSFISILMLVLNLMISKIQLLDRQKNSSFECGFLPLSSSRLPFSIHFYLISILFLIFDVEVVFLFSMIDLIEFLNFFNWFYLSIWIMFILYLGLEFEKKEGSLKWMI